MKMKYPTSAMDSLVKCSLFYLLLALAGECCGFYIAKEFRSDYEWSDMARGWLKYHAEPATWDAARLSCHAEGAILASPLTNKLKWAVKSFVQKQQSSREQILPVFTGVHASFSNGDYSSIEGVPLKRLAITWALGEPNNEQNSERCLAMSADYLGTMADTRCGRALPFVCYKKDTSPVKEYRFDYEWSEQVKGWLSYHEVPATWDEAMQRCQMEGAVLASPLNHQLETAIVTLVQNQEMFHEQGGPAYIGVTIYTGVKTPKTYSSIEGVPLQQLSISWAPGEPSSCFTSARCLALSIAYNGNGTMADTRCDNVLPYVCYKKDTSLTITKCGTADPKYVLEPRTGSCYKFYNEGLLWTEAYKTCIADGGYLAVVNSNVEVEVLKDIYSKHPSNNITALYGGVLNVGIHDWGHHGTSFMTIHGDPLDAVYNRWHKGEPNNATTMGEGQSCGAYYRDGTLDDNFCNVKTAFLCEKMPESLLNL